MFAPLLAITVFSNIAEWVKYKCGPVGSLSGSGELWYLFERVAS